VSRVAEQVWNNAAMFDAQQCLLLVGLVIAIRQVSWALSSSIGDQGELCVLIL